MTKVITLLICDDHRLLTDALVSIVGLDGGIRLVTDPVDNGEEAIDLCARHRPDVVLMDIYLRGRLDGIEATRRIKDVSPQTKVVVVSGERRMTCSLQFAQPQRERCSSIQPCWRACCPSWRRSGSHLKT